MGGVAPGGSSSRLFSSLLVSSRRFSSASCSSFICVHLYNLLREPPSQLARNSCARNKAFNVAPGKVRIVNSLCTDQISNLLVDTRIEPALIE